MSMTPRDRVLTVLNHEEPDRVPIVIGVSNATGIKMQPYQRIKRIIGDPCSFSSSKNVKEVSSTGNPAITSFKITDYPHSGTIIGDPVGRYINPSLLTPVRTPGIFKRVPTIA